MARIAMTTVIAVVVAVAMVARLPMKATGMTCGEVDFDLLPCLSYIRNGGDVPSECCNGLSTLVDAAKTKDDRQTACNCLKSLASGASNDELNRAAGLPDKCGISLPYKLSPSTDCSKIEAVLEY